MTRIHSLRFSSLFATLFTLDWVLVHLDAYHLLYGCQAYQQMFTWAHTRISCISALSRALAQAPRPQTAARSAFAASQPPPATGKPMDNS
ncbi:uncharacterized protein F5147DRAFT_714022 [Suillus discolor]|uniref:Uncharacterized protein n=1 Tax=Suillus discolor TaxID=1912936 RepID=A0A9P7EZC4_9AGAM|nr:uncharacterized protein F5147DRAFT_714022 [Suillus discolor]KAG2098449.1 hypothetical protein F5147DRAFT_714022 [Suillus discolor]